MDVHLHDVGLEATVLVVSCVCQDSLSICAAATRTMRFQGECSVAVDVIPFLRARSD